MGIAKWSGQIVAWMSTLVVTHLLTPADYGLVGMATLYLGALTILSEFGFGAAIVAFTNLTQHQIRQINSVSVLFGVVGFLLSCALAGPIGQFFHAPALPPVVIALSTTFFIASFRSVPWALLQRDMRFKRVAVFEGIQSATLAGVSIALAILGFRYWTLVIAAVLSSLIATTFALTMHWVPFSRPRLADLRHALSFSNQVILQRISWFIYSNADFFVAARVLGQDAYGAYTVAWTLANTPIDKVGTLALQVTPSVFAAVQTDRAALARYVTALVEGLSLVLFPLLAGIAIVAPDFVPIVLGKQWVSMVVPLQILAAYSCFRSVVPLLSQVLLVTGKERFAARNMMFAAIIMPIAFYIGGKYWGLVGIAMGWLCVHPIIAYRLCRVSLETVGLRVTEFMARALWPAVSGCLAMAVVVAVVRHVVPAPWSPILRLVMEVVAGTLTYVALLLTLHRERIAFARRSLVGMAKS